MKSYSLRLYIAGENPVSRRAISNLRILKTKENIDVSYQIIDLVKNPEQAEQEKILATPTLIKDSPLPSQRIIGDLSDLNNLFEILDIDSETENDSKGQNI